MMKKEDEDDKDVVKIENAVIAKILSLEQFVQVC